MRFPSIATLIEHAAAVLRRFPWTLAAGVVAAFAGNLASGSGADDLWSRVTFVAALVVGLACVTGFVLRQRELSCRSCRLTASP